jgi:hypothetical protein
MKIYFSIRVSTAIAKAASDAKYPIAADMFRDEFKKAAPSV